MEFKDILEKYMNLLDISQTTLAKKSNLSISLISRYKCGNRIPKIDSKNLDVLVDTISSLSNIDKEKIEKEFNDSIKKNSFNYELFSKKFNELINVLHINIKDMANFISYDYSYISRIKNNERKPAYPIEFTKKITNYVIYKYTSTEDIKKIASLIDCDLKDLKSDYYSVLNKWLSSKKEKNYTYNFLHLLNDFNLNDYIKVIKFDELKVPSIPFYKVKNKTYYGLEEIKCAELEFFKSVVLNKQNKNVFMCSDMPMEDMANDLKFSKSWMYGIALSLKKGIHFDVIHNLDRNFNEIMLGIESWIPLYMTGLITPYYFKNYKCNFNRSILYTTNNTILTGECINDYHSDGMYYITSNRKELDYYNIKKNNLLKKASPLMEIYKEENKNSFNIFLNKYKGDNKRILHSLPLFTISDKLLISILKRNNIDDISINKILEYKSIEYDKIIKNLENYTISDIIRKIDKNDFNDKKISLSLENIFFEKQIYYTYEEFQEHFELTKKFLNKNYKLTIKSDYAFNNINIIMSDNYGIVSKCANPIIHFVIKHPKLVQSLKEFKVSIREDNNEI